MKIKDLIDKKYLSATVVISVFLTLINIILMNTIENDIYVVVTMWKVIISSSFILILIISIIKRNIKCFLKGIIYIVLCIAVSYVIMVAWIVFFL